MTIDRNYIDGGADAPSSGPEGSIDPQVEVVKLSFGAYHVRVTQCYAQGNGEPKRFVTAQRRFLGFFAKWEAVAWAREQNAIHNPAPARDHVVWASYWRYPE